MKRRTLLAGLAASALGCRSNRPEPAAAGQRIVSLAPGVTDALFAIGAGAQVVARSDYCDYPAAALSLPRVGTSLTPAYETITRLAPSLIVGEAGAGARRRELEALGPTLLLPWLTLDEIVQSIRTLGERTGNVPKAESVAASLERRLRVPAPADGPRVLLVIGYDPGKLEEIWFIRNNSVHGAVLHAAGARNAVTDSIHGLPRLSPERLVELDPDAIFVLARPGSVGPRGLEAWRRLTPLRAVRENRVLAIEAPEAYVHGPRILGLIDRLAGAVRAMGTRK